MALAEIESHACPTRPATIDDTVVHCCSMVIAAPYVYPESVYELARFVEA